VLLRVLPDGIPAFRDGSLPWPPLRWTSQSRPIRAALALVARGSRLLTWGPRKDPRGPRPSVPVVTLDPADLLTCRVWHQALGLLGELERDWTLVGGLMVQLHATRYGVGGIRPTVDIDVLADIRQRPSAIERIGRSSSTSDSR
jgi:hypothetical protein